MPDYASTLRLGQAPRAGRASASSCLVAWYPAWTGGLPAARGVGDSTLSEIYNAGHVRRSRDRLRMSTPKSISRRPRVPRPMPHAPTSMTMCARATRKRKTITLGLGVIVQYAPGGPQPCDPRRTMLRTTRRAQVTRIPASAEHTHEPRLRTRAFRVHIQVR